MLKDTTLENTEQTLPYSFLIDRWTWLCATAVVGFGDQDLSKTVKTHSHVLHKQAHAQKPTNPSLMSEFLGKCVMWLRFAARSKITQAASQVWNKSANDLLSPQKCALNMMGEMTLWWLRPQTFLARGLLRSSGQEREEEERQREGDGERYIYCRDRDRQSGCSVTSGIRLFWLLRESDDTAHLWGTKTAQSHTLLSMTYSTST